MMTAKELAEQIASRMDSRVWMAEDDQWTESLIRQYIGHEKQEWNRRCNEACKKQVHKQVNEAYEQAARIAELESFIAAKQIRALKIPL